MDQEYYTWITDNMAIGELNANYDSFDIVVNLAYINPNFNKGLQHREKREKIKNGKKIYEFGLYDTDSDSDYLLLLLTTFFEEIGTRDKKILFHCQSGKSRSVMFAIKYLQTFYSLSTEQALDIIKKRRPIANPRQSFIKILNNYK
jgi:protein-tyrosine phosphatase